MCHFVHVAVPNGTGETIEAIKRSHRGLQWLPDIDAPLLARLPAGAQSFMVITGQCSCDLVGGPQSREDDSERRRRAYRKKGWSESKIQRAIGDHERTRRETPRPYVPHFVDALEEAVRSCGTAWVIVRWLHGRDEDDPTPVEDVLDLSIPDLKNLDGEYPLRQIIRVRHAAG